MNIKGTTKTAGLLGYPVAHTMSPLIHNTLAEYYGDDLVYLPFCVEPERLKEAIEGAAALGVSGLNVTVPHKSNVMKYLVDIDPVAGSIGAVNTLCAVYEESRYGQTVKGYRGFNTDILGLKEAMAEEGFEISGRSVLILGAGGAARAVAFLALNMGASDITIANRSSEKASALAGDLRAAYESHKDAAANPGAVTISSTGLKDIAGRQGSDGFLCFQCTSAGLYPDVDACPIEDEDDPVFDMADGGIDLIYCPAETLFMKRLAKRGKKTMNGASMLLYQGVIAYEMFTGRWNGSMQTPGSVLGDIRKGLIK